MICKKCGKTFPGKIKEGDSYHNFQRRKYCFECSPVGSHNTKTLEILDRVGIPNKSREKQKITDRICEMCHRSYKKTKTHKLDKLCASCSVNKRRMWIKGMLIAYKGGKCIKCGYNKCSQALIFHHRNPDEKSFTISGKYCLSMAKLKAEADKCDLLCCRCHAETYNTKYSEFYEDYSI